MASNPTFQTRQGLNGVCSGARFNGALVLNTEDEFNHIEWLDFRPKPKWNGVEAFGLDILRHRIANNINKRTNEMILDEFRFSLDPDIVIDATMEWQFDMLNLWLVRDSGLVKWPYNAHVGMNMDASPRFIEIESSEIMQQFYLEMFGYISGCLDSGRVEKGKLKDMTRTGLEEYRDIR